MRRLIFGLIVFAGLTAIVVPRAHAQVEIDRVLSRIEGQPITTGDVRAARMLKLVAGSSDGEVLRALENRRLKLLEVARLQQPAPSAAAIAERRRAWLASLGGGDLTAQLAQAGMTEERLTAWMSDDVRIARYEEQRFAGAPDRQAAVDHWVQELRRRYGLPVR
jgi:hypothetical protein